MPTGIPNKILAPIKKRLPSREDLILVFGGVAFIVHIWAIINLLEELPAWVLRMSIIEVFGMASYVLVFALLESLVVWALLVMAAFVLPYGWLSRNFVPQGMAVFLVTALWAVAAHFNTEVFVNDPDILFLWLIGYIVSLLVAYFLAGRFNKFDQIMRSFLQRILVLSVVYVIIDVVGLILVFLRNI